MQRMQRLFIVAALAVILPLVSASAQSPNKQFGMGVSISGGGPTTVSTVGGSSINFVYAINPAFHIGAGLGLEIDEVNDVSYSGFAFGVNAKFLLAGPKEFKPFIGAGFGFRTYSVEDVSVSTQSLGLSVGGEYFATPNMGIYGSIFPVRVQFGDVESTSFGLAGVSMGMEWFF